MINLLGKGITDYGPFFDSSINYRTENGDSKTIMRQRQLTIWMMIIVFLPWVGTSWAMPDEESYSSNEALRAWLQPLAQQPVLLHDNGQINVLYPIARFYENRRYRLVWVDKDGLRPHGVKALELLRKFSHEGVLGINEDLGAIETRLSQVFHASKDRRRISLDKLVQLDVLFTQMVISLMEYRYGNHGASNAGDESFAQDHLLSLSEALEENCLAQVLNIYQPTHNQYQVLKHSLQRYEAIKTMGGWPILQAGRKLKTGRRDIRVPILRWRLVMTGDMPLEQLSAQEKFDPGLAEGVRRFQRRHGLKVDGIVGKETLSTLNIPVEERIRQIKVNLERWRRLPDDLGSRYIVVNIPNYNLDIVENNTIIKSMRVIVGKIDRSTPELSKKITYLELNPYWNIPHRIARKDILPRIQNNPDYLDKYGIQVFKSWQKNTKVLDPQNLDWDRYSEQYFPFRLRQKPAYTNALGRVKFVLPNPRAIYIHDTPNKMLFNNRKRSYSSGCIRIEKPLELVNYLLKDQPIDRRKVRKKLSEKRPKAIVLKNPIPVYLVYFTSWRDDSGTIHFREDLYKRDRQMIHEMASDGPVDITASFRLFSASEKEVAEQVIHRKYKFSCEAQAHKASDEKKPVQG